MVLGKLKRFFTKMSSESYNTLHVRESKWNYRKILYVILATLLILALIAFIAAFIIIPIVFMLSFSFQDALMFTRFGLPSDIKSFDLKHIAGLKNFYVNVSDIETNNIITLGAWHLLPWPLVSESVTNPDFDYAEALANGTYKVLVHFHGTGETRRDSYTLFLWLRIFFHVIAFDYRSYGDSTKGKMSEKAVIEDCVQFYKWVISKTDADVYVWGHSLGASLATSSVAHLKKTEKIVPNGLILEAPFTTMREEIPVHPYGRLFAWLPWFEATMLDPLERNGFHFNNVQNILDVDCPVMILNAKDDSIVPYRLGQKLADIATSQRNETQGSVTYYRTSAAYGCDHYWIYLDPDLPYKIWGFLKANNMTENVPRVNVIPPSKEHLRFYTELKPM